VDRAADRGQDRHQAKRKNNGDVAAPIAAESADLCCGSGCHALSLLLVLLVPDSYFKPAK
jgi:methylase of polypeptide subunit release factors